MEHINAILKKGNEKLKEFQEIESFLSYPEIIADQLYFKHLLLKKQKLNNVVKLTTIITDQIGQLNNYSNELVNASAEFKELINQEISKLHSEIENNAKILQLMLLGDDNNSIVVQLTFNTKNEKIIEKMLSIYKNYCKNCNLTFDLLNFDISNQTIIEIKVSGKNSNILFKNEIGIHKIKFENQVINAEIITYPFCENQQFELNENEIKIETFRSSGAGGQHVNRTNSAVRITHLPTGITAKCQNQRSQIQNKSDALKILISKLSNHYNNLQLESLNNAKQLAQQTQLIKIREYDFNCGVVCDVRLNKTENIEKILNGNLDIFNNLLNF